MRIVNREQFLKMPSGTIFCKWHPCVAGDITIKGENTLDDLDFGCLRIQSIEGDLDDWFKMAEQGASFPLDLDCYGRDGCEIDKEQLFLVYEKQDVLNLIDKLKKCAECY